MRLWNDEIAAVDGVHRHLGRLMDGYLEAARLVHDPSLARIFECLAAERAAMRKHVGLLVMALGQEPGDEDPDRRALGRLARRARELFRVNLQPMLVRELERKEDALAVAIAAALAIELPERTASILARISAAVERGRRQLAEARIGLSRRPAGPRPGAGLGQARPQSATTDRAPQNVYGRAPGRAVVV